MNKTLIALGLAAVTSLGAGIALAADNAAAAGTAPGKQEHHEFRHGKHEGHGAHRGKAGREGFGQRDGKKPESFSETSTRTYKDGRKQTRKTDQVVSDGKLERKTTLTNTDGKQATHTVSQQFDANGKVVSRTVKGAGFDGKTFERSTSTRKTDKGIERKSSWTNPDGKTGSRTVIQEGESGKR